MKSGDRLPPERDLAEKFVVSRTSVREALRALENSASLEIRPGEGTFVREVSVETLIEPLAFVMASQRAALSEPFEARRLLEPSLAELAARAGHPRGDLGDGTDPRRAGSGSGRREEPWAVQDAAFHAAIGRGGKHNRAITAHRPRGDRPPRPRAGRSPWSTPGRPRPLARGSPARPRGGHRGCATRSPPIAR